MATQSSLLSFQMRHKVGRNNERYLQLLFEDFRALLKEIFETGPKELDNKDMAMNLFTIVFKILYESKIQQETKEADELYSQISKYLKDFLSQKMMAAKELRGTELLTFYSKLWTMYQSSSKALNAGAVKLNKLYIKKAKKDEIRREVLEIYWLALITWKQMVFDVLHKEVSNAVLDLIEKERGGERVDSSVISGAIGSYVELGLVDKEEEDFTLAESIARSIQRNEPHLTIYQKYFEKDFWKITESAYYKEARDFLNENADFDACKQQMEKRLEEELKRVEMHLHKSTGERVKKSFEVVFKMISDVGFGWNEHLHKHEKI